MFHNLMPSAAAQLVMRRFDPQGAQKTQWPGASKAGVSKLGWLGSCRKADLAERAAPFTPYPTIWRAHLLQHTSGVADRFADHFVWG
jgi:hypothetical protein